MGFSEWYCIDFRVIRRKTNKAYEIIAADNKIYWLPFSHVSPLDRDFAAGDRDGSISVTEWFAKERGWIGDESA